MLKKFKGNFIILTLIMLLSTNLIAAETNDSIGLDQIVGLAIEENLDLQLAELNLEDARLDYKKSQLNNLLTNSRLMELQSELAKIQAEDNFNNIRDNVILDVIGTYIDIISLDQQIITAEKEVVLQERKVEEVEAQVEVGYKGSLELFEQETSYLSAVNSLERLKDDLAQKLRELKQKISVNEDIKIDLVNLVKPEVWKISEKEAISTSVSNNTILEIREQQVVLAENDLEKARVSGTPELDLRKKEIALQRAKLALTQEKQNMENNAQNIYYQYKQSVKNMEMVEKSLIQAEEHYKIIQEQNEAGLVSKNDLLSSELSLYQAMDRFTDSIINYYLSMLQLQKTMGLELEVTLNNENSNN
ncbi:MAG: TolC family protein [Halanaerobiales bacterium]